MVCLGLLALTCSIAGKVWLKVYHLGPGMKFYIEAGYGPISLHSGSWGKVAQKLASLLLFFKSTQTL
jgi:hypothetical protein